MTKNQKILEAIKLIEGITRSQWITGAIMGSNTQTILAVELLKSSIEKIEIKPRKTSFRKKQNEVTEIQDTKTITLNLKDEK